MKKLITLVLILIIVKLITLLFPTTKDIIQTYIYNESIDYSLVRNFYNNNLNGILPFEQSKTKMVSSTYFDYYSYTKNNNTYKYNLKTNTVYSNHKGIILKINSTSLIIETSTNKVKYSNLDNIDIKVYDNIEKGTLIGTTSNKILYVEYL